MRPFKESDLNRYSELVPASYDSTRKKYIPCIGDFYSTVVERIPFNLSDKFSVLDTGAGTGLLSSIAKKAFPSATLTLADVFTEMLNQVRSRFRRMNNVRYEVIEFETDEINGSYEIVVSALALHHFPLGQLQRGQLLVSIFSLRDLLWSKTWRNKFY